MWWARSVTSWPCVWALRKLEEDCDSARLGQTSVVPFCSTPILIKYPMDFRAQVRLHEIANG